MPRVVSGCFLGCSCRTLLRYVGCSLFVCTVVVMFAYAVPVVSQPAPSCRDSHRLARPFASLTAEFSGFGCVFVSSRARTPVVVLSPGRAVADDVTHSAAVLSRSSGVSRVGADVRLVRQLRPVPNPWESGWLLSRYSSSGFYYAALKTNGVELGRGVFADPGAQRFLFTASSPAARPGRRTRLVFSAVDAPGGCVRLRLRAGYSALLVASALDCSDPLPAGRAGFYAEDARVEVSAIRLG